MTETQAEYKTKIQQEDNGGSRCLQTLVLSQRPLIRAYRGDCMDWMQATANCAYDLAIVDPPYGLDITNIWGAKKYGYKEWDKKDWDKNIPDKRYFTELRRVSKNQIIWGGNYYSLSPTAGWVVWDKGQRDFTLADGEMAWTSFNKAMRIYEYSRAKANNQDRIHPTQKPVALYRWLLQNYAKAGQRILDTHGGSFSSAVACFIEGYDLDICEIDAEYFEAGVKRFKQATKQMGLFDDRAV